MFRRKRREVPELNTTSTADISFMLLVFFLVTSSMDADKGLGRKLPPIDEQQQEQRDISRSNVLQLRIDDADMLYCDDKPVTVGELQRQVESFVASRQTDKHMIAVETSRKASYNAYFEMQNAIVGAYRQLREQMARREYGHPFSQCNESERDAIIRRYPQRISEGMAVQSTGQLSATQKGGRP
jgi:biopolymer transport protein ExbD